MALTVGTRLGTYEVLARLGAGGMGEVYRAHDDHLGRDVAIKFLPQRDATSPYAVERFIREARAASALNHPNIVTIYDARQVDIGHFIVMELVRGRTLRALIGKPFDIDQLRELALQIAKALAAVHEIGIVHRDIKPENIMVRDDGYVKVLDFGLALLRSRPTAEGNLNVTTISEAIAGTLRYMSPEQGTGQAVDQATDVFSLGIVLYELATGRHPFESETPFGVLHAIISNRALTPARLHPDLPPAVATLILGMLEKEPRNRPSAVDVAAVFADPRRATVSLPAASGAVHRHTVGREKERADLRRALEEASAGRGLMVCVSGEPGIGKSTLVEDFLAERQGADMACRVARGRCSERLAGTEAYLPLLDALENLLGSGGGDGSSLGRLLKTVAPLWHAQLASASTEILAAQLAEEGRPGSQERLKREFVAFLSEVSGNQPLILLIDDVHWADISTIDLLSYLGSRLPSMPILIVVTYRPEELLSQAHAFLRVKHDLQTRGSCRELQLEFLTPADVEVYVRLEFADHQFPPSFVALIHEKTDGNPLFMVDLLRYLRDREVLSKQDGRWKLGKKLPDIARALPESIRSMIQRKIDALDEIDRRLLIAASVQGYEFDGAVIARSLAMDPADVEDRLQRLDRIHALARTVRELELPDGTLTLKYRFVHLLYQNLLYATLTPARKVAITKTVTRVLEEAYGPETSGIASELAVLCEGAREFGRAASYFLVAAQHAARVFAYQEVVLLARRGLSGVEALPQNEERKRKELALLLSLSVSLTATKGFGHADVEVVFDRAHALCLELHETAELFRVVWGLARHYTIVLRLEDALRATTRLFDLAAKSDDPTLLVQAHFVNGTVAYLRGDFTAAVEHFQQVRKLYDPLAHQTYATNYTFDTRAAAGAWCCCALWILGYPDRSLAEIETTLEQARKLQHSYTLALTLFFAVVLHQFRCEWNKADAYSQELLAVSSDKELAHYGAATGVFLGLVQAEHGDREDGVRRMEEGLAVYQATGAQTSRARMRCQIAQQLGRMGHVEDALKMVATEIETAGTAEYHLAELYRVRGELLAASDETAAAAAFTRALEVAQRQQAKSFELRAVASLYRMQRQRGHQGATRRLLEQTCAWFAEGLDTADLVDANRLLETA